METDKWYKVVDIIQSAFREGLIPSECAWQMVVLVPKGKGGLCSIGIMDFICKTVLIIKGGLNWLRTMI